MSGDHPLPQQIRTDKMKKRLLSAVLAMIMACSVIPAAFAAQTDLADSNAEAETVEAAQAQQPAEETEAPAAAPTEALTEPETEAPTEPGTEAPTQAPVIVKRPQKELAPTSQNYPEITRIAPTANGLKLTWTAYPDAYKYFIFIRNANGGWKKIGTTSATSFEHKGLTSDTLYEYTVRAADSSNKFISAFFTDGWDFHYLAAPKLVRTESTGDGLKLIWDPVEGAEAYRVYLRSGTRWIVAGTTDTSYCIDTRVTSGKAYTFTVRCWDVDEDIPLSYFDTEGCTGTYIAAPQLKTFSAVDMGVTITWNKVDGASRYAVFRKLSTGWKRLGITDKLSFTDTGLRYSARYTYTLRCLNSSNKYISGYNTKGWAFTHLAPPEITDIKYRDSRYTIKWGAQKIAASYRVYRMELGDKWRYIGSSATNSFVDDKAKKDGVYTYTVRSMDADDNYLTYYKESGHYYRMGLFVIGLDGTGHPNTNPRYTCQVTEDDLRGMVACIANGWLGAVEGDEVHADILAYYNTQIPLPVEYEMQVHDAWCAAFVSAVWLRAGIARYIGTECGCGRFIDIAEKHNIWVESDAYIPKVGDAIIYNWSDSGYGECVTGADHIGLVTAVDGSDFVVTEGNTGTGYVGSHDRIVNCQYIRGYITPNYDLIAKLLTLKSLHT